MGLCFCYCLTLSSIFLTILAISIGHAPLRTCSHTVSQYCHIEYFHYSSHSFAEYRSFRQRPVRQCMKSIRQPLYASYFGSQSPKYFHLYIQYPQIHVGKQPDTFKMKHYAFLCFDRYSMQLILCLSYVDVMSIICCLLSLFSVGAKLEEANSVGSSQHMFILQSSRR